MKKTSVYFKEPYKVDVREEILSKMEESKVTVKTFVSAISAGTELLFYKGEMPQRGLADGPISALKKEVSYPLKYGYSAVGRVVEIGKNVSKYWQDKMVFAFNPHENYFNADPSELFVVPDEVAPRDAVFLAKMETAINFFMDGNPQKNEVVIIFGQGVVGLFTTMLVSKSHLNSLVTFDLYSLRREYSLMLGASQSLDPNVSFSALEEVFRNSGPNYGANLIYDLSGNTEVLNHAISLAGFNGRIIVGSWYGGKISSFNINDAGEAYDLL